MTEQHPITPSPELVERCIKMFKLGAPMEHMCKVVAQWGADQQLEACDDYVAEHTDWPTGFLTSAMRPKPPSLKEQGLNELQRIEANISQSVKNFEASCEVIRRALEALDD